MRQASIPWWWLLWMTQETRDIKVITKRKSEKESNRSNINNKSHNQDQLIIVKNSKWLIKSTWFISSVNWISQFEFMTMIRLLGLSFLLFILRLSFGKKFRKQHTYLISFRLNQIVKKMEKIKDCVSIKMRS